MNGRRVRTLTPQDVTEGAKQLKTPASMNSGMEVRQFLEDLNGEGMPPSRGKTRESNPFEDGVRSLVEDKRRKQAKPRQV